VRNDRWSGGLQHWVIIYARYCYVYKGKAALRKKVVELLDEQDMCLPILIKNIVVELWEQYTTLTTQSKTLKKNYREL
jgi:hypothetical protein